MRTSFSTDPARGLSSQVRYYLGLTQDELALYLNVTRNRVADNENVGKFSRRDLTPAASWRLLYLNALLPPGDPLRFAQAPAAAFGAAPASALPVPAPPVPDPAALKLLQLNADIAAGQATLLRLALEARTAQAAYRAQVHRHVQAVAVAFVNPPAPALALRQNVPDDAPDSTAFLRDRLTRRAAAPVRLAPDLTPLALARDTLRLGLLETEAATLAAWLAAPG